MGVVTPGGFEGFFSAAASRRPGSADEIATLGTEYGLSFLPG